MEGKLRNTVLQLKDSSYIHYSKVQKYNKFGYQALFINRDSGRFFQVLYFSKSVLNLNALTEHLNKTLTTFRTLNSRKITPVLQVQNKPDEIFVISPGFQYSLQDLITKREGLTQFQTAYFLGQMYELFGYFKSREVLLQKIDANELFLNEQLKVTVGFSVFLNIVFQRPIIKRLPFRVQYRNRNNCPDLFFLKEINLNTIDQIHSWIMGIITYQIILNKLPFPHVNDDLIGRARGFSSNDTIQLLNKQYIPQFHQSEKNTQIVDLIRKLLKPNPSDRLRFSFVIIHPFIKKFAILPHILPNTVFSCPPSEAYKEQYFKKFLKQERTRGNEIIKQSKTMNGQDRMRSQKELKGSDMAERQKLFKTQHQIVSEITLSQNFVMVEQFVDISDTFGFGYQMNTGIVGFVFNDQTQFLCLNGSQQIKSRNRSKKKQQVIYSHDKLPQEDEVRKKIFILQAFSKTLKRKRICGSQKQRSIIVSQYCRTKYASMFLLSNDSVQVFFNDKMIFYLTKNQVYLQLKNSQKYERYEFVKHDPDLQLRKDYCVTVAQKVFLWDSYSDPTILESERVN